MRYPKGLARRADEILAARRQTAQERHRRMMAALDEQHPEIRAVGRELALLYAQRARLQLDPVQDTGEVEAAIHEAQARRAWARPTSPWPSPKGWPRRGTWSCMCPLRT